MKNLQLRIIVTLLITLTTLAVPGSAVVVNLTQGTSDNTQAGGFSPDGSVDGIITGPSVVNGWAIGNDRTYRVAAWETTTDISNVARLDFTLHHVFGSQLLIGRFRLSITDDNRSLFADGLDIGGDVTANWTQLGPPLSVTLPAGMTYSLPGDNSILTAGTIPATGVYQLSYAMPGGVGPITGVRLEVLTDPSLPLGLGPGWNAGSGNFVLSELQLDAQLIPEPGIASLLMLGAGLVLYRRRS